MKSRSLITPDRIENLLAALRLTESVPGDMAEIGVYRGGSAREIAEAMPGKRLHLFDTFTGLPYSESPVYDSDGLLPKGEFACSEIKVRKYLKGCNVAFHPGLFPETAVEGDFSFVHADCDLYGSTKAIIDWFWPRMFPGGIMFFDDYGCKFTGVTRAVDESFTPTLQYDVHGFQIGAYVRK